MTERDLEQSSDPGPAAGPRADRPKARTFTMAYKRAIVAEYDAAGRGKKGVILRRERLYETNVSTFRKQLERADGQPAGTAAGTGPGVGRNASGRGGPAAAGRENERLRKEVARLEARITTMQAALDIMGKARELLEALSGSADSALRSRS